MDTLALASLLECHTMCQNCWTLVNAGQPERFTLISGRSRLYGYRKPWARSAFTLARGVTGTKITVSQRQ